MNATIWIFLIAAIVGGVYRGLQTRFGANVIEGWCEYRRDLQLYGTTASELRRARHDPETEQRVRAKYDAWISRFNAIDPDPSQGGFVSPRCPDRR